MQTFGWIAQWLLDANIRVREAARQTDIPRTSLQRWLEGDPCSETLVWWEDKFKALHRNRLVTDEHWKRFLQKLHGPTEIEKPQSQNPAAKPETETEAFPIDSPEPDSDPTLFELIRQYGRKWGWILTRQDFFLLQHPFPLGLSLGKNHLETAHSEWREGHKKLLCRAKTTAAVSFGRDTIDSETFLENAQTAQPFADFLTGYAKECESDLNAFERPNSDVDIVKFNLGVVVGFCSGLSDIIGYDDCSGFIHLLSGNHGKRIQVLAGPETSRMIEEMVSMKPGAKASDIITEACLWGLLEDPGNIISEADLVGLAAGGNLG